MLAAQRDNWREFVDGGRPHHGGRRMPEWERRDPPAPGRRSRLEPGARERELIEELSAAPRRPLRASCLRRGRAPERGAPGRARGTAAPSADWRADMRPLRQARTPEPIALGERRGAASLADLCAGRALRAAHAPAQPGVHRRRRPHARARHRREHRDLQPGERHAAPRAAGPRAGAARPRHAATAAASSRIPSTPTLRDGSRASTALAAWGGIVGQPERATARPSSSAASSSPATTSTCSACARRSAGSSPRATTSRRARTRWP